MNACRAGSGTRFVAVLLCSAGLSGCAIEHPSMSLDSISRRPFFGLQVVPKKNKDPVYDRTISSRPLRGEGPLKIQTADREIEPERHWPTWLSLSGSKPVVPLPRTDLPKSGEPVRTANADEPVRIEF